MKQSNKLSPAKEKISSNQIVDRAIVIDHPMDNALPGIALLFDSEIISDLLIKSVTDRDLKLTNCKAEYVRYKPATNCLVAYKATWTKTSTSETIESLHFGKSYLVNDYEPACKKIEREGMVPPSQYKPFILVEDQSSIIYHCQYDRELKAFETIANPRKLNRILHEILTDYPRTEWRISDRKLKVDIIRFKPEKRAVVRVRTKVTHKQSGRREKLTLYLRCYCDNRGLELYNLMNSLYEGMSHREDMPLVAKPIAYLDDINLLFMEEIDGDELLSLLGTERGDNAIAQTAKALAQLHQLESSKVTERTAEQLISDAATTVRSLSYLLPDYKDEIDSVIDSLKSAQVIFKSGRKVILHGDFYYDQVLVQSERIAFLDFERSYLGDPLADLANFSAHLYLLQISGYAIDSSSLEELFIKAYERNSSYEIDRNKFKIWKAYCLTLLSVSPFRRMKSDWKEQSVKIIKECRSLLS